MGHQKKVSKQKEGAEQAKGKALENFKEWVDLTPKTSPSLQLTLAHQCHQSLLHYSTHNILPSLHFKNHHSFHSSHKRNGKWEMRVTSNNL
jgi:hypothetical protein